MCVCVGREGGGGVEKSEQWSNELNCSSISLCKTVWRSNVLCIRICTRVYVLIRWFVILNSVAMRFYAYKIAINSFYRYMFIHCCIDIQLEMCTKVSLLLRNLLRNYPKIFTTHNGIYSIDAPSIHIILWLCMWLMRMNGFSSLSFRFLFLSLRLHNLIASCSVLSTW